MPPPEADPTGMLPAPQPPQRETSSLGAVVDCEFTQMDEEASVGTQDTVQRIVDSSTQYEREFLAWIASLEAPPRKEKPDELEPLSVDEYQDRKRGTEYDVVVDQVNEVMENPVWHGRYRTKGAHEVSTVGKGLIDDITLAMKEDPKFLAKLSGLEHQGDVHGLTFEPPPNPMLDSDYEEEEGIIAFTPLDEIKIGFHELFDAATEGASSTKLNQRSSLVSEDGVNELGTSPNANFARQALLRSPSGLPQTMQRSPTAKGPVLRQQSSMFMGKKAPMLRQQSSMFMANAPSTKKNLALKLSPMLAMHAFSSKLNRGPSVSANILGATRSPNRSRNSTPPRSPMGSDDGEEDGSNTAIELLLKQLEELNFVEESRLGTDSDSGAEWGGQSSLIEMADDKVVDFKPPTVQSLDELTYSVRMTCQ